MPRYPVRAHKAVLNIRGELQSPECAHGKRWTQRLKIAFLCAQHHDLPEKRSAKARTIPRARAATPCRSDTYKQQPGKEIGGFMAIFPQKYRVLGRKNARFTSVFRPQKRSKRTQESISSYVPLPVSDPKRPATSVNTGPSRRCSTSSIKPFRLPKLCHTTYWRSLECQPQHFAHPSFRKDTFRPPCCLKSPNCG